MVLDNDRGGAGTLQDEAGKSSDAPSLQPTADSNRSDAIVTVTEMEVGPESKYVHAYSDAPQFFCCPSEAYLAARPRLKNLVRTIAAGS